MRRGELEKQINQARISHSPSGDPNPAEVTLLKDEMSFRGQVYWVLFVFTGLTMEFELLFESDGNCLKVRYNAVLRMLYSSTDVLYCTVRYTRMLQ